MTPGQTQIPVPEGPVEDRGCDWCQVTPSFPYEIEKARYTTAANGQRVEKRRPLTVRVCGEHRRQFDAQKETDA